MVKMRERESERIEDAVAGFEDRRGHKSKNAGGS
jgi:hypothetical protein